MSTIKNYQKRQRRKQREAYREVQDIVHRELNKCLPYRELREKEQDVYDSILKNK